MKDGYWLGFAVGVVCTLLVVVPSACAPTPVDKATGKSLIEMRIDHVEKMSTERLDAQLSRIEQLETWAQLEPPETRTCPRKMWRCPCPK